MNNKIVVAVIVIAGLEIWDHYTYHTKDNTAETTTALAVGAFVLLGILAFMDTMGLGALAGALAMLAMTVVIIDKLPNLLITLRPGPGAGDVSPDKGRQ